MPSILLIFNKDIISHSAGDAGIQALSSITRLCNLVLSGIDS